MTDYTALLEASARFKRLDDPAAARLAKRLEEMANRIAPRAPMLLARHGGYLHLGPPGDHLEVPHPEMLGLDYFEQIAILGMLAPASLDAARLIGDRSHPKPGKVVRECIVKASQWIEAAARRGDKTWGPVLAAELRHPLLRVPDSGLGIERSAAARPILTSPIVP